MEHNRWSTVTIGSSIDRRAERRSGALDAYVLGYACTARRQDYR